MFRRIHLPTASPQFRSKNRLIAISCGFFLCFAGFVQAGSATWDLNPISGDWNTATNWTPVTVPNGAADTATFGLSNITAVSVSTPTIVDSITFAAGASVYTITASPGLTLTFTGAGIINNSGITQNFVAAPTSANANAATFIFNNSATAGTRTSFTMNGGTSTNRGPGWTFFNDSSSAGEATFTNNGPTAEFTFGGGATLFSDRATAAHGTFINNGGIVSEQFGGDQGLTNFGDTATAASGTFTNNAGVVHGAHGGTTAFGENATAANGVFINQGAVVGDSGNGFNSGSGMTRFFNSSTAAYGTFTNAAALVSGSGGGFTEFHDGSTAANGKFVNDGATVNRAGGGFTYFYDSSSAGDAILIANGGTGGGQGGTILFEDESSAGRSQIKVFGNGNLDISFHSAPGLIVGSIEGNGNVYLGANRLTLSTDVTDTFGGRVQDGGLNGGSGGSLTKIGQGIFALTGSNSYTGDTNIKGGVLEVDGSINSNTFVHHGGTLAGAGAINASVTNNDAVRPGAATPGTLTIKGNYMQTSHGTLLIDIAGTSTGQSSLLDVFGSASLGGLLDPVLLNGFVPSVGESFTFLEYGSHSGSLFIHDRNIDDTMEHWVVTYQPGEAVLTVAPGNVSVPDRGSTLLLLTLGLVVVAIFRSGSCRHNEAHFTRR